MFRKKEHKKIVILCRERKREIERESGGDKMQ